MRGAALLPFFAVCVAFGQPAVPQGPSSSINQQQVLRQLLKQRSLGSLTPRTQARVQLSVVDQGNRCAIPLAEIQVNQAMAPMPNVLRGTGGPAAMARMPVVRVPAPSCKDIARTAPGLVQTGPNSFEYGPRR